MTTIVIDGQAWARREQVAHLLSRTLRCPLVAADGLALHAARMGYDGEVLLSRLERRYGFRRRLEDYLAYLGVSFSGSPGFLPFHYAMEVSPEESETGELRQRQVMLPLDLSQMRRLLPELLKDVVAGFGVVVGCGAQGALRNDPNVLKVFLVAPGEVRIQRAALEMEADLDKARERVRKVDEDRRSFLKQVYDLSWDDPATYDLVLDAGALEPHEGAALVLRKLGMATRVSIDGELLDAVG